MTTQSDQDSEQEAADRQRRTQLRSARRRASLILAGVAGLFALATALGWNHGALGFVQAGAEASMVGGVADWFAVVAVFRRPLGLPIPHTAVIVERKDQFGEALGRFVQEHFLNADVLAARLKAADAPQRLADWLADPEHARRAASRAAELAVDFTDLLREEDVRETLAEGLDRAIESVPVTQLAGRALRLATSDNRHAAAVDSLLNGLDRMMSDNEDALRERFRDESPRWVPEIVDDAVFDRLLRRIRRLLHEVAADPAHRYRQDFDRWLADFVDRLESSPEMAARAAELRQDLLSQVELRELAAGIWADLKRLLREQATDPDSELRNRLSEALRGAGRRLDEDPALRATVEQGAQTLIRSVADQFQPDLAALVSSTIERWDARDTAERLELLLGRDLQFIRINGTVVGALVGLGLHGLAVLVG